MIDFAALGTWHFSPDDEQQAVQVDITAFGDQRAHEEAQDEDQALDLLRSALVTAYETFGIKFEDPRAVRIIHITEEQPKGDQPAPDTAS